MSSLDEKTLREVAEEYDIVYGTLARHIWNLAHGLACPFPVRYFKGIWLIDTGSEEFQDYLARYNHNPLVRARREGRLKRKPRRERVRQESAMPQAGNVWTMFVPD